MSSLRIAAALVTGVCLPALAQTPEAPAEMSVVFAPVISAAGTRDNVRFVVTGSITEMRVVVSASRTEEVVFDSGWKGGTSVDWPLAETDGKASAGDSYDSVVTARDGRGNESEKKAILKIVGGGTLRVTSSQDSATASPSSNASASASDAPVLPPPFDVPDLNPRGATRPGTEPSQPAPPMPNVSGSGTANRIPLWLDGAGTLGDSIITQVGPNVGIGTTTPTFNLSISGGSNQLIGMERNTGGLPGRYLIVRAGGAAAGSSDQTGGDLILTPGIGTGLGASGNLRLLTGGAGDAAGTTTNFFADRVIYVAKAKVLPLTAPASTPLMSIRLTGTHTAGGRVRYVIRATDGANQVVTESGEIQYVARAGTVTCTVEVTDKISLGTVDSTCVPGFFNPGAQPGVAIADNVAFSSPAPIVVHEVYFSVENHSGSTIRLEP